MDNPFREEIDRAEQRRESRAMKAFVEHCVFASGATSLQHSWTAASTRGGKIVVAEIRLMADVAAYDKAALPKPADLVMEECDRECQDAERALQAARQRRRSIMEARREKKGGDGR